MVCIKIIKQIREMIRKASSKEIAIWIAKIMLLIALISLLQSIMGSAFSGAGSAKEFWEQVLKGNPLWITFLAAIIILIIFIIILIYAFWGGIVNLKYFRYIIKKIYKIINVNEIRDELIECCDTLCIRSDEFEEYLTKNFDEKIDYIIKKLYGDYICDKCLPKNVKEKIKKEVNKEELRRLYIPKKRFEHWFDKKRVIQ